MWMPLPALAGAGLQVRVLEIYAEGVEGDETPTARVPNPVSVVCPEYRRGERSVDLVVRPLVWLHLVLSMTPLLLAAGVRTRLGVGWRAFLVGLLAGGLSGLVWLFGMWGWDLTARETFTSDRLLEFLAGTAVIPPVRPSDVLLRAICLGVIAGLAVEGPRYYGLRWLRGKERLSWSTLIMMGLGFAQGLRLDSLYRALKTALMTISDTFTGLRQSGQLEGLLPDSNITELLWLQTRMLTSWVESLALELAFTVLVLQAVRGGRLGWLWLAAAGHVLLRLLPHLLGIGLGVHPLVGQLPSAGVHHTSWNVLLVVFDALGLAVALWVIWALRDRVENSPSPVLAPYGSASC
jgi:hypothetical protein